MTRFWSSVRAMLLDQRDEAIEQATAKQYRLQEEVVLPSDDPELDGDRRSRGGRAARAAEDRSLAMHRRLQRVLTAGIVLVAVAVLLVAGRSFLFSRYFVGFDDDAVAVYEWALKNAASLNGDPKRVALAGESAGLG